MVPGINAMKKNTSGNPHITIKFCTALIASFPPIITRTAATTASSVANSARIHAYGTSILVVCTAMLYAAPAPVVTRNRTISTSASGINAMENGMFCSKVINALGRPSVASAPEITPGC